MDFQRSNRLFISGASVVFWTVLGAALGALAGAFYSGGLLGFCVGFYAAMAESKIARILSMPGMVFGFIATALSGASHT